MLKICPITKREKSNYIMFIFIKRLERKIMEEIYNYGIQITIHYIVYKKNVPALFNKAIVFLANEKAYHGVDKNY